MSGIFEKALIEALTTLTKAIKDGASLIADAIEENTSAINDAAVTHSEDADRVSRELYRLAMK